MAEIIGWASFAQGKEEMAWMPRWSEWLSEQWDSVLNRCTKIYDALSELEHESDELDESELRKAKTEWSELTLVLWAISHISPVHVRRDV